MRFINRFAAFALFAVLLVSAGGTAFAQQVTGLAFPPFNPNQHVYKSRPIANTPGYDVNINGLDQRIMSAASGLRSSNGRTPQVYELIVKEPDGGINARVPGGAVAATILGTYRNKAAAVWPDDDFILLVLTRSNSNPNDWYVGVRVGTAFAPYISLPQIGNILSSDMPTLRSGDVQGFSEQVVRDVSHFIGNQASAGNPVRTAPITHAPVNTAPVQEAPSKPFPWGTVFLVLIIGGGIVGGGIFLFGRSRKLSELKEQLANARAKTDPAFKNLNGCVATIQNNYGGMEQGTKSYAKGSESDRDYQNALTLWAQFRAQINAAKERQAAIDSAANGASLFNVAGLETAIALATSTAVEVSSKALDPSEVSLLGGLVNKQTMSFPQLISTMATEFDTVNSTFAALFKAVSTAQDNASTIKTDLTDISAAKTTLEAAGLSFAPFQAQYDEIAGSTDALLKKVGTDPKGALAESETQKSKVEALRKALDKAVELKKGVVEVSAAIETERKSVATVRATRVNPKFGGASDATFALSEEGGNPDGALAQADAQLKALSAALDAGKVPEAEAAKDAALAAVASSHATVQAVLDAKAKVESDLPAIQASQEPGFAAGFSAISALYTQQRFIEAAAGVVTFQEIAAAGSKRDQVKASLAQNDRITSGATDASFASAEKALVVVVDSTRVGNANWLAVEAAAKTAAEGFDHVQTAINADITAHAQAQSDVAEIRKDFDAAQTTANDKRVDDNARHQLAPLGSQVTALEGQIATGSKLNWADVSASAKRLAGSIAAAHKTASDQIAEAEQYEEKLDELHGAYNRYDSMNYSRTIRGRVYASPSSFAGSPYATAANAHYAAAQAYYEARDYARMQSELALMEQQLSMANTFMWFAVWNSMYTSGDPWARQYAYDQGYRDGMAFDSYNTYVVDNYGQSNGGETWGWQPAAESSWTPSQPVSSCGGSSSSSCGGSSSSGASSCGGSSTPSSSSCGGSSSSSCSSSSSSSSCSSSSSSCSSSSSSSCSSSSSSSCGGSSSSCGGSSSSCGGSN